MWSGQNIHYSRNWQLLIFHIFILVILILILVIEFVILILILIIEFVIIIFKLIFIELLEQLFFLDVQP